MGSYKKREPQWVDCRTRFPEKFDLVECITDTNNRVLAWWTGLNWDGKRLYHKKDIIAWRKYDNVYQLNKRL